MSAIVCWWCGAAALGVDVTAVGPHEDAGRVLAIRWPDYPQDHVHSAQVPAPEDVTEEGMRRFMQLMGVMQ